MMARAFPKLGLRPFLPADAPLLAEVFRAAIEDLTADDYSPSQQEAWASSADDEEAFAKRLGDRLTLVATLEGSSPVGFISLEGPEHIDMLYVHPAAASQGVATMLYDAIEKLAASRGAARLTADASDNAREFFEHRGFVPQQRNTVMRGNEWLANTTMEKKLTAHRSAR
jgi:putative acetyltransferase